MASISKVLYIGVTNNLSRRVLQHRLGTNDGFTKKYNCKRLVYYEYYTDIKDAIKREKELKGLKRCKKIELIEEKNKDWLDYGNNLI